MENAHDKVSVSGQGQALGPEQGVPPDETVPDTGFGQVRPPVFGDALMDQVRQLTARIDTLEDQVGAKGEAHAMALADLTASLDQVDRGLVNQGRQNQAGRGRCCRETPDETRA